MTINSESPMILPNSAEVIPEPKTRISPPTLLTISCERSRIGVSGLSPPWPAPPSTATSCETVASVPEADADCGLKSFVSNDRKPGCSAAARTAASISVGVACSTARICASMVLAFGSICSATTCAALEVSTTSKLGRSARRSWASNIQSNCSFERTFGAVWISWVVPLELSEGAGSTPG